MKSKEVSMWLSVISFLRPVIMAVIGAIVVDVYYPVAGKTAWLMLIFIAIVLAIAVVIIYSKIYFSVNRSKK